MVRYTYRQKRFAKQFPIRLHWIGCSKFSDAAFSKLAVDPNCFEIALARIDGLSQPTTILYQLMQQLRCEVTDFHCGTCDRLGGVTRNGDRARQVNTSYVGSR